MLNEGYREYVVSSLERYWKNKNVYILGLPVPTATWPTKESEPPEICEVKLPTWAQDLGIDGCLIVPRWATESELWHQTDWFGAIFWFLNCEAERAYEKKNGPIHSYSFRLRHWDERIWERAWVNRMAMFLRRWASYTLKQPEESLFGPLPFTKIWLTHDVDAVHKTLAIRIKQAVFCCFNSVRFLLSGRLSAALTKGKQALRFLFGRSEDYCHLLDKIACMEEKAAVRGIFLLYAGNKKRKNLLSAWLFDPSYDIKTGCLKKTIVKLAQAGWSIGLHQSYHSWKYCNDMTVEKARMEDSLGMPVTMCRQHWLRFSWRDTWQAQAVAGLKVDFTLGFNDRTGFRNAAAIMAKPCISQSNEIINIDTVPLVLMDSHLYDYSLSDEDARLAKMKAIIDEVYAVRGQASILWHPHTLSSDYNWGQGFEQLLNIIKEKVENEILDTRTSAT
ncbi:MAG: hypothetical protein RIN56_05515 [Sporomusaceae bacterium]|nr:hypothetical protein [Sporomusaceae bacterium]